jgi:NADH pyrophosphatase NudC (nudix superfamily)
VVAVVMRGEETLVIRCGPATLSVGMISPITGRLEPGESEYEAVIREVREEVGLEVRPIRQVWECPSEDGRYTLRWWLTEYLAGELTIDSREVSEAQWINPDSFGALEGTFADDRRFYAEVLPRLLEVR